MKNLRFLLTLSLLLVSTSTFAAEARRIAAPGRISSVTVFNDRALVSRSATLALKPGSYLVVFEGLPVLLQDDSVRVEGRGSAVASIVGLEVRRAFLEQSGEKRVKELDEEIRTLERRLGGLDAKRAGLSAQRAFLDSIRVAWSDRLSKELAIGRPTSAEMLDASSFVGAGVTRAEEQSRDIDSEKKGIKDKIDAVRRQRDEATGSRRKEAKSVEVAVEISREGNLTLDLSSVISQASWEPAYDVRLAADSKSAEMVFRAMVRQQTGEDWNDVDLTLSTARPSAGAAPQELTPWRIDFYRPMPAMAMPMAPAPAPRKAKMAAKVMMERAEPEEAVADEAASFVTAQVSDESSSVSFRIPRKVDVPADGSRQGSVVALEQLPVSMEYLAIPKSSPHVFLRSEIVNRAAYPLLPGKVNAFIGNTFTGSSQLKKIAAGERFELFFGGDDQVTVKREELKQHKEAGMFGKNRVSYRYRIELANFRKEALTLTVRDQLPVAGDEEIKVTLDEPSLKPEEIKRDGSITWKAPLAAGEKRELTFGIVVEYPKDRELSGL